MHWGQKLLGWENRNQSSGTRGGRQVHWKAERAVWQSRRRMWAAGGLTRAAVHTSVQSSVEGQRGKYKRERFPVEIQVWRNLVVGTYNLEGNESIPILLHLFSMEYELSHSVLHFPILQITEVVFHSLGTLVCTYYETVFGLQCSFWWDSVASGANVNWPWFLYLLYINS